MSAQNAKLDTLLSEIKKLEDEKSLLDERIKQSRSEVVEILEKETDGQYKNDLATVSYVERKTIKYESKEAVIESLKDLPKYFDVIPERKELNKTFESDIKNGVITQEGVSVEVLRLPQIRFNK